MPYEMNMIDDNILWAAPIGDMGDADIEAYFGDEESFLETATEAEPLHILADAGRVGKMSAAFRKRLVESTNDPRVGKVATVGGSRYSRVIAGFILKATRRDNLRLFETEEEALAWLKAKS